MITRPGEATEELDRRIAVLNQTAPTEEGTA